MNYSHTRILLTLLIILICHNNYAKEGMWIPATLQARQKEMKEMGLEISIEQLYNTNGTGFNSAVVLFGKGCTGEIISKQGLILTNHHCGYGTVQGLSSTTNDYFAQGFFAKDQQSELKCGGLTITFIRRMENVTDRIIHGLSDTMSDSTRNAIVSERIQEVEQEYVGKTGMEALIKPYFDGNQYWVAIMETYKDIRLVGFPPNGIGEFGGDDENWSWPRHTGDFSLFRVYADKDNKPANYSPDNKPYDAGSFFKINPNGYKEGDFTMVYGFPGTTNEYISSYELDQTYSIIDPISIKARTKKLEVWTDHMNASRDVFIKYTSKRAGVANGWKKWQGELKGLKVNHAIKRKRAFEKEFARWAKADTTMPFAKDLLPTFKREAEEINDLLYQEVLAKEAVYAIELMQQGMAMKMYLTSFRITTSDTGLHSSLKNWQKRLSDGFYKNYDQATDKDLFVALMPMYMKKSKGWTPDYYKKEYRRHKKNYKKWANYVFRNSIFASQEKLADFIEHATPEDSVKILRDPIWQLYTSLTDMREAKISPKLAAFNRGKHGKQRLYMKAQMAMLPNKEFYPDANLTQRLAYGHVKGLKPDGKEKYAFQTTLDDLMAHEDSSVTWFKVPDKLKDLYNTKDYGQWGVNGTVPLAFVADNHTTGGNSGSPVLNARGELIGTNFDRAYEGTMSDYLFDPNRCRNISLDIRYTLFIIEKFGDAKWVIDELDLVE